MEGLQTLPQFRANTRGASVASPQSPVTAFVNLRGLSSLSSPRTLVLFDGRRVNPSVPSGQVDVNSLPSLLIKRVDVVTGGASAAYGTDAIAGVVNYVLDRNFTGVKADFNAGVSQRGDDGSQKAAIALGGKFLDGRLHLLGSVEYYNSDGITSTDGRKWAQGNCEPIQNPTYPSSGPNYLLRCGVAGTDLAPGGVVTSGPLKGIQFLSGGGTAPYNYGSLVTNGATMVGGDGVFLQRGTVTAPERNLALFSHVAYDLTDNVTLFIEAAYSHNKDSLPFIYPYFAGGTAFTVTPDNPFLPSSVRTQMAAAGATSIQVGRAGLDWGESVGKNSSNNIRGTAGFDARLGGDWTLNGYVDAGQTKIHQDIYNMINRARAYEAADAVLDPATNQIVCRSTLTNPGNGCSALNIFGQGSASASALSYIMGHPWTRRRAEQEAGELALRGSPFRTWAGEVSLAAGIDYRRIEAEATIDPISSSPIAAAPGSKGTPASIVGVLGGWLAGNQTAQPDSSYNVKEVFGEVDVPLAKDLPFAQSLNLNGAVRYANYSTAGGATSWKGGLTYSPISDIHFRATRSRDVRAPNLAELYGTASAASITVFDPATNQTVLATQIQGGNPDLKPEFSDTTTAGVILTPRFLPGFSLSADYYDIKVKGAISNLSFQQVVNLCFGGQTDYCNFITRVSGASGAIKTIDTRKQNLNTLRTQGIDFEANYALPLANLSNSLGGTLNFRGLVSYLKHLTTTDAFGTVTEFAGVTGGELTGAPKWQGTVSVSYADKNWTIFADERLIDHGRLSNLDTPFSTAPTGPGSIDYNRVAGRAYTDLTVQRAIKGGLQLYATVNNLFDRDPPLAPTRTGVPFLGFPTNGTVFDVVGRYITIGFRIRR
jgi:outer membrane receptor protein involved in Fe transport